MKKKQKPAGSQIGWPGGICCCNEDFTSVACCSTLTATNGKGEIGRLFPHEQKFTTIIKPDQVLPTRYCDGKYLEMGEYFTAYHPNIAFGPEGEKPARYIKSFPKSSGFYYGDELLDDNESGGASEWCFDRSNTSGILRSCGDWLFREGVVSAGTEHFHKGRSVLFPVNRQNGRIGRGNYLIEWDTRKNRLYHNGELIYSNRAKDTNGNPTLWTYHDENDTAVFLRLENDSSLNAVLYAGGERIWSGNVASGRSSQVFHRWFFLWPETNKEVLVFKENQLVYETDAVGYVQTGDYYRLRPTAESVMIFYKNEMTWQGGMKNGTGYNPTNHPELYVVNATDKVFIFNEGRLEYSRNYATVRSSNSDGAFSYTYGNYWDEEEKIFQVFSTYRDAEYFEGETCMPNGDMYVEGKYYVLCPTWKDEENRFSKIYFEKEEIPDSLFYGTPVRISLNVPGYYLIKARFGEDGADAPYELRLYYNGQLVFSEEVASGFTPATYRLGNSLAIRLKTSSPYEYVIFYDGVQKQKIDAAGFGVAGSETTDPEGNTKGIFYSYSTSEGSKVFDDRGNLVDSLAGYSGGPTVLSLITDDDKTNSITVFGNSSSGSARLFVFNGKSTIYKGTVDSLYYNKMAVYIKTGGTITAYTDSQAGWSGEYETAPYGSTVTQTNYYTFSKPDGDAYQIVVLRGGQVLYEGSCSRTFSTSDSNPTFNVASNSFIRWRTSDIDYCIVAPTVATPDGGKSGWDGSAATYHRPMWIKAFYKGELIQTVSDPNEIDQYLVPPQNDFSAVGDSLVGIQKWGTPKLQIWRFGELQEEIENAYSEYIRSDYYANPLTDAEVYLAQNIDPVEFLVIYRADTKTIRVYCDDIYVGEFEGTQVERSRKYRLGWSDGQSLSFDPAPYLFVDKIDPNNDNRWSRTLHTTVIYKGEVIKTGPINRDYRGVACDYIVFSMGTSWGNGPFELWYRGQKKHESGAFVYESYGLGYADGFMATLETVGIEISATNSWSVLRRGETVMTYRRSGSNPPGYLPELNFEGTTRGRDYLARPATSASNGSWDYKGNTILEWPDGSGWDNRWIDWAYPGNYGIVDAYANGMMHYGLDSLSGRMHDGTNANYYFFINGEEIYKGSQGGTGWTSNGVILKGGFFWARDNDNPSSAALYYLNKSNVVDPAPPLTSMQNAYDSSKGIYMSYAGHIAYLKDGQLCVFYRNTGSEILPSTYGWTNGYTGGDLDSKWSNYALFYTNQISSYRYKNIAYLYKGELFWTTEPDYTDVFYIRGDVALILSRLSTASSSTKYVARAFIGKELVFEGEPYSASGVSTADYQCSGQNRLWLWEKSNSLLVFDAEYGKMKFNANFKRMS